MSFCVQIAPSWCLKQNWDLATSIPNSESVGGEWIKPRNCWTPGVSWSSWICRHEPRWLVKGFLGCGKCWHRWQAEKFRCQFRDGVFWLVKCCDVMRFHSEWLKILLNITSNHPFYPSLPIHSLLDRSDMDLSSVFPTCPISCPPFLFLRCLIQADGIESRVYS